MNVEMKYFRKGEQVKCINPVMYCLCLFAIGNCFASIFFKGCGNVGLMTWLNVCL